MTQLRSRFGAAFLPRLLGVTALLAVAGSQARGDPPDAGASGDELSVHISGLRNDRGHVRCGLWASERGFPKERAAALRTQSCDIAQKASSCAFDQVPAGNYAVACFHDENDNGVLDTGLFGIPVEGVVASNQAKGFMGPPKFKNAMFRYAGAREELLLKMGY